MTTYHIAQMNLARLAAPIDSPQLADFVARLDEINHLADRSPGFVWRFQAEDGHALDVRAYEDKNIVVNMSVWETIEALFDYSYYSAHVEVFRRRREWFTHMERPYLVMWWVPAGHEPTITEADERLAYLREHGPTPHAFDFKTRFTVEEMLAYTAAQAGR